MASYSAENFVQRNRLQAALGRILIPAEWNRRSGTAHTVRFATSLGRPIACLRLPEWCEDRVVLERGMGLPTGEIFTVPHDQARFDAFVRTAIGKSSPAQLGQLRSEEHTSELQSLMRISYAVFCLTKKSHTHT